MFYKEIATFKSWYSFINTVLPFQDVTGLKEEMDVNKSKNKFVKTNFI